MQRVTNYDIMNTIVFKQKFAWMCVYVHARARMRVYAWVSVCTSNISCVSDIANHSRAYICRV